MRPARPSIRFFFVRQAHPAPLASVPSVLATSPDFQNTQGIIFVVDSNDRERVSEAREELQRMLNEDELRDALLLVFANKQDLPNAMNAAEITDKLGLHSLRQRTWYIQATCATSGDGLYEGLEWVSRSFPFLALDLRGDAAVGTRDAGALPDWRRPSAARHQLPKSPRLPARSCHSQR